MASISYLVLVALFAFSAYCQKGDHFVTFLMHRHGARNPGDLYNDTIFSGGKNKLTEVGYEMVKELGSIINLRMSSYKAPPITANNSIIFSSPVSRALESAQGFIEGFFSESISNWIAQEIKTISTLPKCRIGDNRCIFYFSDKTKDIIFHGESEDVCPKNSDYIDEITSTPDYLQTLKYMQKSRFPFMAETFNKEYYTNFDINNVTWSDFSHMQDVLYCASNYKNAPLAGVPVFSEKWTSEFRRLKFYQQFITRYGSKPGDFSKNAANGLFSIVKQVVQGKIAGQINDLSYVHFSGHDVALAGILLELLDIEAFAPREDSFIPFAGSLEISLFVENELALLENESAPNDNLYVEVYYDGSPVTIRGNDSNKMKWSKFVNLLVSKSEEQFFADCGVGAKKFLGK